MVITNGPTRLHQTFNLFNSVWLQYVNVLWLKWFTDTASTAEKMNIVLILLHHNINTVSKLQQIWQLKAGSNNLSKSIHLPLDYNFENHLALWSDIFSPQTNDCEVCDTDILWQIDHRSLNPVIYWFSDHAYIENSIYPVASNWPVSTRILIHPVVESEILC